jgi:hypothetical protein
MSARTIKCAVIGLHPAYYPLDWLRIELTSDSTLIPDYVTMLKPMKDNSSKGHKKGKHYGKFKKNKMNLDEQVIYGIFLHNLK